MNPSYRTKFHSFEEVCFYIDTMYLFYKAVCTIGRIGYANCVYEAE